ncbi:carotenoid 9,10(9',10')-cleavage dioxygenase-like [Mangifera indica]|uniref:carotenoid 9,10(9',10')-cleavage dioxygenase-like n=1 Tax=Mangifera indica TaxID=29780 RepID=UPI001CFA6359|nr:carotenoid 9,10(9',10')-cleavage dioxygenase-like [Mangifera indica]
MEWATERVGLLLGCSKRERPKDVFLPKLRFGDANGHISNTNVFEHSGKVYVITENYIPQELNISTLETYDDWDVNDAWNRPFTSHPKKDLVTGELVIMGFDATKPFYDIFVHSADGTKLSHKADLKFDRGIFSHEIGVTQKYNVIMDCAITADFNRLLSGGLFVKYENEGRSRIGVIPRYGNANSAKWFEVKRHCSLHPINRFEDGHEVVVRQCRSFQPILLGPNCGQDRFEWFTRGFTFENLTEKNPYNLTQDGFLFTHSYEWRLNMETGEVKERNLSGTDFSIDFPVIDEKYTGLKHKYGFTQVIDSTTSSIAGLPKYGGLAKLHLDEPQAPPKPTELVEVKYHRLAENNFFSGTVFVAKHRACEEDDGWLVSFVHNEETNKTRVHIIDAKKLESGTVAKIALPQKVPYGFHGTFVPILYIHIYYF